METLSFERFERGDVYLSMVGLTPDDFTGYLFATYSPGESTICIIAKDEVEFYDYRVHKRLQNNEYYVFSSISEDCNRITHWRFRIPTEYIRDVQNLYFGYHEKLSRSFKRCAGML